MAHTTGSIIITQKATTIPSLQIIHDNIKDVIFYKMIRLYDSCTYVHTAVRHTGLYFLISDVGRKNKGGRLVVCLI